MGGCTSCGAKQGCDHRKGDMLGQVTEALVRLYPTRRWGEPDDEARYGAGIAEAEARGLAAELAAELAASVTYRPGGDEEYCDYLYILCVGREPSLVRIRDGGAAVPDELGGEPLDELYLRVCLSHMARMAGVQQVRVTYDADGGVGLIREHPRPGVYDAPLLSRFQRLVAILGGWDILHVDFGEISAPPEGFDPGDYAARYGGEPHTANYLFFPQPSTTRVSTVIDGPARR